MKPVETVDTVLELEVVGEGVGDIRKVFGLLKGS